MVSVIRHGDVGQTLQRHLLVFSEVGCSSEVGGGSGGVSLVSVIYIYILGTLRLVKRCRGICWCSVRSDAAVKLVVVVVACHWSALYIYIY